jgi:ABC-type branched-subunit amino acid transport system substrate-binding protein
VSIHTYPADANPDTYDFGPVVSAALATAPDALAFVSAAQSVQKLIAAAWRAGYRGRLYTTATAGNENLTPFLTAEQAAQVRWATLEDAAGPSVDFVRRLWTNAGLRSQDFVGPVLSNYDGMFVLGLALAHANSTDGEAIAASMRAVADPPGMKVYAGEWAKALDAIEAGVDIDYVGVASPVDFDDLGNTAIGTVLKGYQNGQPVVIEH